MRKLEKKLLVIAIVGSVFYCIEGARAAKSLTARATGFQEVTFNLTRLAEDPKRYSLVISDTNENVISGTFSVDQLQILRAVMTEAEKFAYGPEAVGVKDSITTRFTDKQERSFIVDVEKLGNVSRLFLTLKTETGTMTTESGKANRNSKREEGFFFDLLTRLESMLPKLPASTK